MMSQSDLDLQNNIEKLRDNLLDMSLRNNLLNFRPRKKNVEIVDEDIASLYNILVINEQKMKFLSNETLDEDALLDNTWDFNATLKDTHTDKFLQTKYDPDELQKRLTHIYRDNRTVLEEQGYNDFFLALGFLEWKEIGHENEIHKAPLVLVPLSIERSSVSQPFTVNWNGDEVRSNLSLIYKLQEQGVEIPDFGEFESEQDLIEYFKEIESIIANKPGWKISKDIFLSNFNFKKFVMFKDLNLGNWSEIENNSIKNLFYVDEHDFDSDEYVDLNSLNTTETYNVVDADSSQLAVLEEAKKGKNLVVQGPPGTGKSQTIVNLIAELMARGQKVLFVSEKKAALDVVKTRLDSVGLGEGCLELHGKNSNKKDFLNELERTLKIDSVELSDVSDFKHLDDIKGDLDDYVNTLHTIYKKTELTPFQLIGIYEYHGQKLTNEQQEILKLDSEDVSKLDKEKRGELIRKLNEIVEYYELVSPVSENIWRNTSPENLTSPDVKEIKNQLIDLFNNLNEFDELTIHVHELIGVNKLNTLEIEPLIDNSKILRPNLKLLNENDDLESIIQEVSTFQNNALNTSIKSLDFNLDLDSLKNEIDLLIRNINKLNIDMDNVNEDDFENLENIIQKISNFQNKLGSMDIDVLNLDLNALKREINTLQNNIDALNIDGDIVDREDFDTISSNFKSNKNFIEESKIQKALDNPNLEIEFNEFKSKRNSFFKKVFDGNFKRIKKQFKSYYDFEVGDDQIESDFEKIISVNNNLTKLRNKINSYSKSSINNDDKIIIESEKLLEWTSELDSIKSKLVSYQVSVQKKELETKIDVLIELEVMSQEIESVNDTGKYFFSDDWKLHNSDTKILHEKLSKIRQYKKCYHELIDLKELLLSIESKDIVGKYYFTDDWKLHNSDIKTLNEKLSNIEQFKKYYGYGYFNDITIEFIESNKFNELNDYLDELSNLKAKIIKQYDNINQKLYFEKELAFDEIDSANVPYMQNTIELLLERIENLNDYRLFVKYCKEYGDKYTKQLIEYIKADKIRPDLVANLFYYNFANIALKDIFSKEAVLDEFNFKLHEEKLSQFKKLDKNIIETNRYRVREILGANRPNMSIVAAPSSGLGILLKEMNKKRKIKPIRKILTETSDVISSIKPCFMMSPLSIAQYLDPKIYESYFDYVIFDEASQVKIEDSLGAMLRGKRYIVIGDTKQLPPTTFFEKELDIDEDEEEGVADNIESILHLCKNTFETKMLKWHYRSYHESLISVSNQEFYNNELYVFPSPTKESEDLGLKFVYDPTTVYNRGSGSNNIEEAENIVEYACDCFRKWGNSRSLGIATFNLKQRNTIMDILEKKLQEQPDLEQFFNEDGEDGFFVKNLENIQGDERDIILISIGYGVDQNNKLSLNFGPLNKEGGERRLNVLITRAKKQCVVFSNFKSSMMHTTERTPKGVEALKTFLYYAESGEFPENYHTGEDFDSPFEEAVYNFLIDEGYTVEKQVGCAGYKIDLAIVDKDDANRYVLGIECDGATYHSSPLARDRDRLRQEVLEGLGWKFHRIWSTDWYHVNKTAKRRLLKAIKDAMKNKDNKVIAEKLESNFTPNVVVKTQEDKKQEELGKYFEEYGEYRPRGSSPSANIVKLIETNGPVHIDEIYDCMKVLTGRIATKKFKSEIRELLMSFKDSIKNDGDFYFEKNYNFEEMKVRRRVLPKIERICPKEIEKSIIYTLELQYSLSKDDLIKAASSYLGFKAVRKNIKDTYEMIISDMKSDKVIKETNGIMELIK
ncbi:DUF4011 domain-containing protein [Methanobrevibacter sp.]|uniref:DUF4011 domain-containing protein n=1 Tax=Methanobrevibacter sp. TaxID=66852 RepID=UPI003D7EBD27